MMFIFYIVLNIIAQVLDYTGTNAKTGVVLLRCIFEKLYMYIEQVFKQGCIARLNMLDIWREIIYLIFKILFSA